MAPKVSKPAAHRSDSVSSEDTLFDKSTPLGDFTLPNLSLSPLHNALEPDQALLRITYHGVNAETIAAALSNGCSPLAIKMYLQSSLRSTVEQELDVPVNGHHVMTYAVERNSPDCLQLLLEYGTKPQTKDFGNVPVIALAIMRTKWTVRNVTEVVKLLLSHGADPNYIPRDMWMKFVNSPTVDAEPDKNAPPSVRVKIKWCTRERRAILVETLNLTLRYYLWRANRFENSRKCMVQIATRHKIMPLLKVPYQMIGQEPAAKLVMENV